MVEPMTFCSFLLSAMIVGAYETRPGIMHLEILNTHSETTEELYVYTEDYLSCWEDGVPVREPGSTDPGGASASSDS